MSFYVIKSSKPQRKGLLKVSWLGRALTKLLMVIIRDYDEPGTVLRTLYSGLQYNDQSDPQHLESERAC